MLRRAPSPTNPSNRGHPSSTAGAAPLAYAKQRRRASSGTFVYCFAESYLDFDWTLFVTLTFERTLPRDAAMRCLREWVAALAKITGAHVLVAWGYEQQGDGMPHFHCLVAFEARNGATTETADLLWRHGFAHVRIYDPRRGAAWYLVKLLDWGFSTACPRRPKCRRRRGCSWDRFNVT